MRHWLLSVLAALFITQAIASEPGWELPTDDEADPQGHPETTAAPVQASRGRQSWDPEEGPDHRQQEGGTETERRPLRCDRAARDVYYDGSPVQVFASPNQWAEIVFPENLTGYLPENPDGLDVRAMPIEQTASASFRNRVDIQVADANYQGVVKFHTEGGRSFHLVVTGRDGCADSVARVHDMYYTDDSGRGFGFGRTPRDDTAHDRRERRSGMRLIEYLWLGDTVPHGYRREVVEGSPEERVVFRQGPVYFFLEEIWKGRRRTGFVLLVENKGRTPFRVPIEQIDFSARNIREVFGDVLEITMNPPDLRLGPAPEHASDAMHPQHRGLIYIVSER